MTTCRAVGRHLADWAALPPEEIPDWARNHLATCRECGRRLAAARLARVVVMACGEGAAPPPGFADRVVAAVFRGPVPRRTETELWRPAWGLMPAFGAVVVTLLMLFQFGLTPPEPTALFSPEGFSAGERLVLGSSAPETDLVLAAVFEESEQ
jgi:hypothetical protein